MTRLRLGPWKRTAAIGAPVVTIAIALTLLIFASVFTTKPGPKTYTSHFGAVIFAVCLAFQAVQLIILLSRHHERRPAGRRRFARHCLTASYAYWATLMVSGLVCLVAYSVIPLKDERIALQLFVFLLGAIGILALSERWPGILSGGLRSDTKLPSPDTLLSESVDQNPTRPRIHTGRRWLLVLLLGANRFLRVIHALFAIMFMAGGISLALTYRHDNPGQVTSVTLTSGETLDVNYFCTSVPASLGISLPTFWFESSPAHGVVDFLGVQTALAETHARNSCSYDPANFGWSARLPASETDFYTGFLPLLRAIDREHEEKIFVGWEGGIAPALNHIISAPQGVRALILFDPSPEGIEWADLRRTNNWTTEQMLEFRGVDLAGRLSLARIILTLAIPWGLLPVFIPPDPSKYFSRDLYGRFRAQSLKEDMWAGQYFSLKALAARPLAGDGPVVPHGLPTFAVMTLNSGQDAAGNEFYRQEKIKEATRIAGGNLTLPAVWCDLPECKEDFVVAKSAWTAEILAGFQI